MLSISLPSDADIAIVGVACRFPGESTNPQAFFDMILNGRSAWSETPRDRFNVDAYYHPSFERQGTFVCRGGYYLKEDVSLFDAPFFSMTQTEAAAMDPQQRILLEVAFEALENAGIPMESIVGTDAACFIGGFTRDYDQISTRDVNNTLMYAATGNGLGMLSNRLSWFYDIRGPSMTVDTACSSSLVALHLACQAIRAPGARSRTALVGGVGLLLSPDVVATSSSLHFLSPDSKCFSFDERANGYARGEGASILILKAVDDAIRDGDTIRAVIRGTGVNQDGKTPGITLPSAKAQSDLIRTTYQNAGLDFSQTRFFEAHGTGTAAGDPLEMEAIATSFGITNTDPTRPTYVGTVKPNIGHLEGCAGVAGVLKAVLALEAGQIPPNINFETPNPKLRLQEWNLRVPTESTPWPQEGLRRVSVNSFGYGGTNAHAILDDALHYLHIRGMSGNTNTIAALRTPSEIGSVDSGIGRLTPHKQDILDSEYLLGPSESTPRLFVISTPEHGGIERLAKSYYEHLQSQLSVDEDEADAVLEDLAYTLGSRRSKFQWRSAMVASSAKELVSILSSSSIQSSRAVKPPKVAWVFTGQGAQWFAMGRELLAYQVFADSIQRADRYMTFLGAEWRLLDEFRASKAESRINQAKFSQPICAALQVALVDLLFHWGLAPSAVIGHSSGEIGAAYAFGALSAEDCWKIAYHRGRLSHDLKSLSRTTVGHMMSVGLSEADFQPYLEKVGEGDVLVVACVNSHSNITVSGDSHAIIKLQVDLEAAGIFARILKVDNAYHSPHMKAVAVSYLESIHDIQILKPTREIAMYSSLTGLRVDASELQPQYWVQNMTSTVQFVKALDHVFPPKSGGRRGRRGQVCDTIVEIGPHAALQGPLKQILKTNGKLDATTYLSILHRGRDATATALAAAGQLWTRGADINLVLINSLRTMPRRLRSLPNLPSYPWNHTKSYWHESSLGKCHRLRQHPRLDLLGSPAEDFNALEPRWKNSLRISELPWLADHKIQNDIIFPGAGMICAAVEAARQIADSEKIVDRFELRDISIGRAVLIPELDDGVEVYLNLKPRKSGTSFSSSPWYEYTFYSMDMDGLHAEHCSGLVKIHYKSAHHEIDAGREVEAANLALREEYLHVLACSTRVTSGAMVYEKLGARGLHYGPTFQGVQEVRVGSEKASISIAIPDTKSIMPHNYEFEHLLHPATLDSCFQSILSTITDRDGNQQQVIVPTSIDSIMVSAHVPRGAGKILCGTASASRTSFRQMKGDLFMSDETWTQTLIAVKGFTCTELGGAEGSINPYGVIPHVRKLCAEIVYQDDVNLLQYDQAQKLLNQDAEDHGALQDFIACSQKAATIYIGRALKTLTPEIEAAFPPYLARYVQWMRANNRPAEEKLEFQEELEFWFGIPPPDKEVQEAEFLSDFIKKGTDAQLMHNIGMRLPGILAGTIAPSAVMVENGRLSEMYADAHGLRTAPHIFKNWFDLKGHKHPDMKILEIGGGTGAIILSVLDALGGRPGLAPRFSSYTLTDTSAEFSENSMENPKGEQGYVEYKTLDIERDILDQGYELGSFDVIATNNALHKTKDISVALRNCHSLLKPGGKLIFGEVTRPSLCFNLISAALPDWWHSVDGRIGGPILTETEWHNKLTGANFSGVDIAVRDTEDEHTHLLSVMVSTKLDKQLLQYHHVVLVHKISPSTEILLLSDAITTQLTTIGITVEIMDLQSAAVLDAEGRSYCNDKFVISLLEIESPLLADVSKIDYFLVKEIILTSAGLLWVTCGLIPHLRAVSGLFRTARSESPQLRLHELHISRNPGYGLGEPGYGFTEMPKLILRTFKSIAFEPNTSLETEIVEKEGRLMIPRLMDLDHENKDMSTLGEKSRPELQPLVQPGRPLALSIQVPGLLDTLHFVDDVSMKDELSENEVEIDVQANGLNFMDVMIAMGSIPDKMLGIDAAGTVKRVGTSVTLLQTGDRVALLQLGAMRTTLRIHETIPQKLPGTMSIEEGASLPTVYVTAYQSLIEIGRLQPGETVLIHSAAGGLGQALIRIAQHIGAEIYVTVGSNSKRDLVMEYGIPSDHIFASRDLTFAEGVLRMTKGVGVDVAVNSLSGEALRRTWECVAEFGRFIEVGKADILANNGLDMAHFLKNRTFAAVNIEHMCRASIPRTASLLRKVFQLVYEGVAQVIQPLTITDYSNMESAFRAMQQGKHVGKVVLSSTMNSIVPVIPLDLNPLLLNPEATYVLVGGLGGLGRGIAGYLVKHGAKNLAFISRSGDAKVESQKALQGLRDGGVHCSSYACDVADEIALTATVAQIEFEMPVIKGVIQGAMVLRDSIIELMDHESWLAATRPKIQGSWNLHNVMPKKLDFFVMLSSSTGIIGNRGQANYCTGNTFQDGLAHYRHGLGLPARSLDLGAIQGLGWVEENKDELTVVKTMDQLVIAMDQLHVSRDQFFSVLKSGITGYSTGGHQVPVQVIVGPGTGGESISQQEDGGSEFWWLGESMYAYLRLVDLQGTTSVIKDDTSNFKMALAAVTSYGEAVEIIQNAVIAKLAKAMMIPASDIDINKPIHNYGVDSLVAIELRNWIFCELKSNVGLFDILASVPLTTLVAKITKKSDLVSLPCMDDELGNYS